MHPTSPATEGRPDTMIYWLGQALRQLRKQVPGLTQRRVADVALVDHSAIWRLEEQSTRWPKKIELVLASYAEHLGVDVRDIWRLSLELWDQHGHAPTLESLGGAHPTPPDTSPIDSARQAFERALLDQTKAPAQEPSRQSRRSPSKKNRRGGGQGGDA